VKKQLLLASFLLSFFIAGCSKSASNKPTKSGGTSTSVYAMYRIEDTSYDTQSNITKIQSILNKTETGDTLYSNPGTKYYEVIPNYLNGYNPSTSLSDTIKFSSTTKGVDIDYFDGPLPFTYSPTSHTFDDGVGDPGMTQKLYFIDDKTLRINIVATNLGELTETIGVYYKKQ